MCFPGGGVVGRARLTAVPWGQAAPLPTARKTSCMGHFGVCPTRATSSDLGEPLTCRHGHGGPRDHAHGHAVGPGRSHGGRVDRRRDAVGLHHGGVMDDVRLRRVHRLGVVSSLLEKGKSREVFLAPGTRRGLQRGKRSPAPSGCHQHAATAAPNSKKEAIWTNFPALFMFCKSLTLLELPQGSFQLVFCLFFFFPAVGMGWGSASRVGDKPWRVVWGDETGPEPQILWCWWTKRAKGVRNKGKELRGKAPCPK